jgi:hypothetical protein
MTIPTILDLLSKMEYLLAQGTPRRIGLHDGTLTSFANAVDIKRKTLYDKFWNQHKKNITGLTDEQLNKIARRFKIDGDTLCAFRELSVNEFIAAYEAMYPLPPPQLPLPALQTQRVPGYPKKWHHKYANISIFAHQNGPHWNLTADLIAATDLTEVPLTQLPLKPLRSATIHFDLGDASTGRLRERPGYHKALTFGSDNGTKITALDPDPNQPSWSITSKTAIGAVSLPDDFCPITVTTKPCLVRVALLAAAKDLEPTYPPGTTPIKKSHLRRLRAEQEKLLKRLEQMNLLSDRGELELAADARLFESSSSSDTQKSC